MHDIPCVPLQALEYALQTVDASGNKQSLSYKCADLNRCPFSPQPAASSSSMLSYPCERTLRALYHLARSAQKRMRHTKKAKAPKSASTKPAG